MIININSYSGVGKLTIAKILQKRIQGRLLDNHSIYNIAFALTEMGSPEWFDTVRAVREIAFKRVLELPKGVPVILTNVHFDSAWENECWDAERELARSRGVHMLIVVFDCSVEENTRRIQSLDRELKRKPREPAHIRDNAEGKPLLDRDGDHLLRLDITDLTAEEVAAQVGDWVMEVTGATPS